MFSGKKIAAVVPCHNEELQIRKVLEGIPDFVDDVVVIDDASTDKTGETVRACAQSNARIRLVTLPVNSGVGAAISRGYLESLSLGADIAVVMGGDGQMDPSDLPALIQPVADGRTDYCKGNRFFYLEGQGLKKIPRIRLAGNFILSVLTKIVSGYWHVSDTQSGYTAISRKALQSIDVAGIYPRYGCPNDILTKLNIARMRVAEVPVNPLYDVGEMSKMRIPRVILPILGLMISLFCHRMLQKYVYRTGHPLVLAYLFALVLLAASGILIFYIIIFWFTHGYVHKAALISTSLGLTLAVQLALSAFEMDFEYNQELNVDLTRSVPPPKPGA